VSVASVGVARSNPDFEALLVLNSILGGKFTSRLNLRLREELGITYGARSGFDMRHGPGPFSAGAAIKTDKTDEGVKEIFAAIEKIRKEQVTEEELNESKTSMIKALPARFESVNETASTLTALAIYGLPLDEFANRSAKIAKVTRDDVLRVAQKYLVPDNMRVVIVGDAAKIKPGLEALKLGKVDVRQPPASKAAPAAPVAGAKAPKAPAAPAPPAPGPKKP
jgi:zinc protease